MKAFKEFKTIGADGHSIAVARVHVVSVWPGANGVGSHLVTVTGFGTIDVTASYAGVLAWLQGKEKQQ